MFIEIRSVVNNTESPRGYWSKWVDKVWDENCEHAMNLNFCFVLTDFNQNTLIIWDGNLNNNTWKVVYYEDRAPKYECGIFVSSRVCYFICILHLFFY